MKRRSALLTVILLGAAMSASADYSVRFQGDWPDSWPKELDDLRPQARTLEGPLLPSPHYAIPFADRDQFEAAWPHLLSVKSPGAPLILKRGENFFLGENHVAGIIVHCPPAGTERPKDRKVKPDDYWRYDTYLELVVDGETVDLNRIELPKDTPIIDERFKERPPK